MNATLPLLFGAAGRRRRRTLLLTLAGLVVTLYILAPFCWLLLTSFMHEQDALSVPPQWVPHRPTLANYISDRADLDWRSSDVFRWILEGTLKIRIDKVYPLEEAASAHRDLEGRKTTGKLLLQV